ncbi:MAG TPA: hypothetical protein VNT60_00010 [Deinococcales bacterium]|nr:hypothetical protein [Deinococcales bacterium]
MYIARAVAGGNDLHPVTRAPSGGGSQWRFSSLPLPLAADNASRHDRDVRVGEGEWSASLTVPAGAAVTVTWSD